MKNLKFCLAATLVFLLTGSALAQVDPQLLQDLAAKNKTPEQKARLVKAVVARIDSRAAELKDQIARNPNPTMMQALKDLEAGSINLRNTKFQEDRWDSSKAFAYYTKALGGNSIFVCPPFFKDSYDVGTYPPDQQKLLVDMWLGERAALLIHETVHMKQQYLFDAGDDEAWTVTAETINVMNQDDQAAFQEISGGKEFHSEIMAEALAFLKGKFTPTFTNGRKAIDPKPLTWEKVLADINQNNAQDGQQNLGAVFHKYGEKTAPGQPQMFGWCRTVEKGFVNVPKDPKPQPYWIWYNYNFDTSADGSSQVPTPDGANPEAQKWLREIQGKVHGLTKADAGDTALAGVYESTSGAERHTSGVCYAVAGPLKLQVRAIMFCQIGDCTFDIPVGGMTGYLAAWCNKDWEAKAVKLHAQSTAEAVVMAREACREAQMLHKYSLLQYTNASPLMPTKSIVGLIRGGGSDLSKPGKYANQSFRRNEKDVNECYELSIEAYGLDFRETWDEAMARLGKKYEENVHEWEKQPNFDPKRKKQRHTDKVVPGAQASYSFIETSTFSPGDTQCTQDERYVFQWHNVLVRVTGWTTDQRKLPLRTASIINEIAENLQANDPSSPPATAASSSRPAAKAAGGGK